MMQCGYKTSKYRRNRLKIRENGEKLASFSLKVCSKEDLSETIGVDYGKSTLYTVIESYHDPEVNVIFQFSMMYEYMAGASIHFWVRLSITK
jgi:hypothetical protein